MGGGGSIQGGKSRGSQDPSSIWGGQIPYLQALYQNAFNVSQGQQGLPGGTGPGGRPDPAPIRPTPNPGHSGSGDMARYRQQLAHWQARQGGAGEAQYGGKGGRVQPGGPGGLVGGGTVMGQQGGQFGLPNITQYSAGLASNLMDQANGQSPYLQQQIGNLGQNIGQFYNQQILPGIASDAGGYGQFGGSRQGIAQGMAGQQALQSFQQGATDLYQNNWNNAPARSESLYNLGMQPYSAQFSPLLQFANLLGRPTVLGGGGNNSAWNLGIEGHGGVTGGGGGGMIGG